MSEKTLPELGAHFERSEDVVSIWNDCIRLDVRLAPRPLLTLSARGSAWVPMLERSAVREIGSHAVVDLPDQCSAELCLVGEAVSLVLRGEALGGAFCLSAWLPKSGPWLQITETLRFERKKAEVAALVAEWRYVDWSEPGEVFSPQLVPEPGDVVGLHVLRSPALTAQSGARATALVGDVDSICKRQLLPAFLNLLRDDGAPVLQSGLAQQEVRGHVYYRATFEPAVAEAFHHGYELYASTRAEPGEALTQARRRLWSSFGRSRSLSSKPLRADALSLAEQVYPQALAKKWRSEKLGSAEVGAITTDRAVAGDIWMCPWFHSLVTAFGLYFWGKQSGNVDWQKKALETHELHLSAPLDRGLFPTVFVFGQGGRWLGSHPQGGAPDVLHLGDMSWTMYWTLRFEREFVADGRARDRALSYARALLGLERRSGGLPAYVDIRSHQPVSEVDVESWRPLLASLPGDRYIGQMLEVWGSERFVESAEDAASLMFLTELLREKTLDPKLYAECLDFARRLAGWLAERVILPAWYVDFEVYWSCAPKKLSFFDERSGQHPQNTLAMYMAAEGLLGLYELCGEHQYLQLAARAMDRLCLYQQIYDPPFLSFDAFGGYAAQNSDGEWSDARQALFALAHLHFHQVTQESEHLERARAACRGSFTNLFHPALSREYPVGWCRSPIGFAAENHGHGGSDHTCGVSSFHWGAGSALTAAACLTAAGVAPW